MNKKMRLISIFLGTLILLSTITACSPIRMTPMTTPVETTILETKDSVEDTRLSLEKSLKDSALIIVDSENKAFCILPFDTDLADSCILAKSGNTSLKESWDELVESIKDLSTTIGIMNPGYSLVLLNPENSKNSLLTVKDGIVLYDCVKD